MKKVCLTLGCGLLAVAALSSIRPNTASAFPEFKKQFDAKYVGDESTDQQKAIAAAVKVAKCNVCHDPNKGPDGKVSKKNHNAYGKALEKFIGKKDKKDIAKIQDALIKVEAMKNGSGPTFGELLKEGKLPVEAPADAGGDE
ncbi:MAG: hypothetical protein DCC68_04110 [Planctomycetota bacterium]|nr:MAG: hypothetical protein DCC68_04110 [Planctomycetota bacterium]